MNARLFVLLAALVGAFALGFLLLVGNCLLTGSTCPPYNVQEVVEDMLMAILGFTSGRLSKT